MYLHGHVTARRTNYFSATKIEWMLREREGVEAASKEGRVRFCTVDALIVHHLTRGARCATEPTNASRTLLFDIEARATEERRGELRAGRAPAGLFDFGDRPGEAGVKLAS